MIKKRLIKEMGSSKKYIFGNVAAQWISLAGNIVMMLSIANLLEKLLNKSAVGGDYLFAVIAAGCSLAVRYICYRVQERCSYLSSRSVKKKLRELIFRKLLRLGTAYRESVPTSEIVQLSVEGVDQLETYYGQFLPQFFYFFLAPITLFSVLLVCVPLIPAAIIAVQKILVFDIIMLFSAIGLYNAGIIDFGRLVVSVIALMSGFGPVTALANLGSVLQNTLAAGNRVLDLLDETPVTDEITDGKDIVFDGAKAESVTFSYGKEKNTRRL